MKKLIITLVISIFSIFSVNAEEQLLTENEFKNENLYQAGENVTASGNYDGISFVAGSEVDVKTNSIFGALAGMNVRFNGITSKDFNLFMTNLVGDGNQVDLLMEGTEDDVKTRTLFKEDEFIRNFFGY